MTAHVPAREVYVVSVDFNKTGPAKAVEATLVLRAEILMLANAGTEDIFLHQFKDDTLGGAPGILLECSPAFLEQVKTKTLYGSSHPVWPDLETHRTDHGGPVDKAQLVRVLAQEHNNDPSLEVATWRLRGDIIALAKQQQLAEGTVLLRHVDGKRGFLSLLCPDSFVDDIAKLDRCAKAVRPQDAAQHLQHRQPKP